MENARQIAQRSEASYPSYSSVVQDLGSRQHRLVTLLALAQTADDTEEYARYLALADRLEREHPEARTPWTDQHVARLAAVYDRQ